MPATTLPYSCSGCGHHYGDGPGGVPLRIEDGAELKNVTLEMSGMLMQCPRCGRMNRPALPDGTYNVSKGRWQLVRRITEDVAAAGATVDDIKHLAEVAKGLAAQEGPDADQIADTIAAETPFTRLAETIRQHPTLSNFVASTIISIIVSVALALIVPALHIGDTSPTLSPHQMDELAHKIAHDVEQDERRHSGRHSGPALAPGSLTRLHPQGRNELCHCGSGVKFKKCCGGPDAKAS